MDEKKILTDLLSPVSKTPEIFAEKLLIRYRSIARLSEAPVFELERILSSESLAVYLKLAISLSSRCVIDNFKFSRKHTEDEIKDYFRALFLGRSVETVYALLFDERDRAIACEILGEGTVNSSAVIPRRLVELCLNTRARSVILAHNHPGANAEASAEDSEGTERLCSILRPYGVEIREHYIFAGNSCATLSFLQVLSRC